MSTKLYTPIIGGIISNYVVRWRVFNVEVDTLFEDSWQVLRLLLGYALNWEIVSDDSVGFRIILGYSFNHYPTLERFSFPDTGVFRFTMSL